MLKTIIIILAMLCITPLSGYGQIVSQSLSSIKDNVKVKKTKKHIRIYGTRVHIVPPQGFYQKDSLISTLVGNQDINIEILDMPKTNVQRTIAKCKQQTTAYNDSQELYCIKEFKMNDLTSCILNQIHNNTSGSLSLIVGDDNNTIMLDASYNLADESSYNELLNSFLTTYIDTSKENAKDDILYFTIDLSDTGYKLANYMPGSYIYSVDGVYLDLTSDKNWLSDFFFISVKPGVSDQQRRSFLYDYFPNEDITINEMEIDGRYLLEAEMRGDVFYKEGYCNVYALVQENEKVTITFIGTTFKDNQTAKSIISKYKDIAKTIRLR